MGFLKTAFQVFLPTLLGLASTLFTPLFANDNFDNLYTQGQIWNALDTFHVEGKIASQQLILRKDSSQTIYETYPLENGFVLVNKQSGKGHFFPVLFKKISFSKNYLFLTPIEKSGFYVVRLIDLHHYAFHSPIPLFFIPLDETLETIENVVAEDNETALLIQSSNKKQSLTKMAFKDVEGIIIGKLLLWAVHQIFLGPENSKLGKLIESFKHNIEILQENFYKELQEIGGENALHLIPQELNELSFEKSTAEELAQALAKIDNHPKLQNLKHRYAEYFATVVQDFYTDYNSLIENMELSFVPHVIPRAEANRNSNFENFFASPSAGSILDNEGSSLSQKIKNPKKLEEDTHAALKWYAGIASGTIFVTLVLPKMMKTPFSQIAAHYSGLHVKYTSIIRHLIHFLSGTSKSVPKAETVESILVKLLPSLEKETAMSGSQFRRAFWQRIGDNSMVLTSEIIARPLFRYVEDSDAKNSILINEPFDKTHSLWFQKNFLYRVVGNQVLGSITSTTNIYLLEKEYNAILKYFLGQDPQALPLTETQKRTIAKALHQDIQSLQESARKGKIHYSASELKREWLKTLSQNGVKITASVAEALEEKIKATLSMVVQETPVMSPQKVGIIQKCVKSIGMVVHGSMAKVLGPRLVKETSATYAKSWELWKSLNETYLWNSILMQTATRGSFNGTIYLYQRVGSLIFTTPLYIAGFQSLKSRGFFTGNDDREFYFGLAHGFITNLITNYIFVNVYEKHLMETPYDLEFSKYFSSSHSEAQRAEESPPSK